MPQIDETIVDQLVTLLRVAYANDYDKNPDEYHTTRDQIRVIGEKLHDKGGVAFMRAVYTRVYQKGLFPGRLLDHLWDGVGGWWG